MNLEPARFDDFSTRMVLLGTGWSPERFARQATLRPAQHADERK